MVKVDTHKRERLYEQEFKLTTAEGVISYLEKLHFFREQRYNGDIDASILYLDVQDAIEQTLPILSEREIQILDYRYEQECSAKEIASYLGISYKAVNQYSNRAAQKIADTIAYMGGYDHVQQ